MFHIGYNHRTGSCLLTSALPSYSQKSAASIFCFLPKPWNFFCEACLSIPDCKLTAWKSLHGITILLDTALSLIVLALNALSALPCSGFLLYFFLEFVKLEVSVGLFDPIFYLFLTLMLSGPDVHPVVQHRFLPVGSKARLCAEEPEVVLGSIRN